MKLTFENENAELSFSLNSNEELVVEIKEDGVPLSINLDNKQMAKLLDALKLVIYESDL
jgi:hypothetical protein